MKILTEYLTPRQRLKLFTSQLLARTVTTTLTYPQVSRTVYQTSRHTVTNMSAAGDFVGWIVLVIFNG